MAGWANTIKRFELKHRDALAVKKIIAPLLTQESAIVVDNNSLIINSPRAELNQLASLIKQIDTPQQKLQIFVYQGKYPKDHSVDKQGVTTYTTRSGVNHLQSVIAEEGRMVSVTNNHLAIVNTANQVYYDQYIGRDQDDRDLLRQNNNQRQGQALAKHTQNEIVPLPTGTFLRATVIGKKDVRIDIKTIALAKDKAIKQNKKDNKTLITLTRETNTVVTTALDQWIEVSNQAEFSHRPVLGSHRQVYSTDTADDKQQSVWVKISLQK